jgi:serine/threonine-protein kinase
MGVYPKPRKQHIGSVSTGPNDLIEALSDRYKIERELGRGGMATVYLAQDVRHGRKVAVKVLLPELAAVLGAERFLSEIHVTAALQHPNILPLFDSGQLEGQLFYVMPYVEGESLRARLDRERQLPIDDAFQITRAVASALDYAHKHGVIHRDIKPENILLQDGHALVADFGIALAVTSAGGGRLTQTGLSLGTPQYMSPEQATGEREIGPRSDVYSLAAVAYEMLAGEAPHTGATMQAVIARMLTERPRSVRSMRPTVSEQAGYALDKALEKIPADRWGSAGEFADALSGKTTIAMPEKTPAPFFGEGASGVRRRLLDPVLLTLGALTLAAVGFAFHERSAGAKTAVDQTIRFPITPPTNIHYATGLSQRSIAISPDGKSIVIVGRAEGESSWHLYTRNLSSLELHSVEGSARAQTAFFSPDGRWLAMIDNSKLRKVSVEGGAVIQIGEVPGIFSGAAWSRKGQILMSMRNGRLYSMSDNGGEARLACKNERGTVVSEEFPTFLDDGDTFVYASQSASSLNSARIAIGSLSDGKCRITDIPAVQPLRLLDGILVYATISGVIMAAPFDIKTGRLTVAAIPVATEVEVNQTTGAVQADISRTGTLAYLGGSASSQLVVVDEHGVGNPIVPDSRNYAYPRYSPDGRKVAVAVATAGERDVWIVDVQNGGESRLTSNGALNDRPEWTPDGKRVMYRTATTRRSEIRWRAADLSDSETALIADPNTDYYEAVPTSDSRYVVYQMDTAGADIFYRKLSGASTPRPIANSQFVEDMARVSPDGRLVAFVSAETGIEEVYVQPFPGPGARVQVSIHGGGEPLWSHDGRKLFYRDQQNLLAAEIRTDGGGLSVGSRQVLFADNFLRRSLPHANYDVSPDGRKFLFLKATAEPQATVAYNWMAEVRAKLAAAESK